MAAFRRPQYPPRILGNVEISRDRKRIFIGGDRKGLRSLAKVLIWLAGLDQEKVPGMPDGECYHVHLHAKDPVGSFGSLTQFSYETELCRLDAKGTGELRENYRALVQRAASAARDAQKRRTDKRAARSSASKRGKA